MRIVRHLDNSATPTAFVSVEQNGRRHPLDVDTAGLLALSAAERVDRCTAALNCSDTLDMSGPLLAPIDGRTEVWAAGVTYHRSQQARMAESKRSADIYERVYDAVRPELFFKATAWKVAGPDDPISVRPDSPINVPEPELALVLDAQAQVVGFTICNDVSSRSIEGENPLYLPQAKVYLGSCALGPAIVTVDEVTDPLDLGIHLQIDRAGSEIWAGSANTGQLHRTFDELVEHLYRADDFSSGAVLATGTCLVPELPFTLAAGDLVRISIDGVGTLSNPVVSGKTAARERISQQHLSPVTTSYGVPT